jgi:hypothetical protein
MFQLLAVWFFPLSYVFRINLNLISTFLSNFYTTTTTDDDEDVVFSKAPSFMKVLLRKLHYILWIPITCLHYEYQSLKSQYKENKFVLCSKYSYDKFRVWFLYFCGFPQYTQIIPEWQFITDHNSFLPHPFWFIINTWYCYSMLHNPG